MHDQIICFDPPKHTDHRALLMRLLTPKRLKENEDFMWRLADRQIDEFVDRGFGGAHQRVREPVRLPGDRRSARRSRGGPGERSWTTCRASGASASWSAAPRRTSSTTRSDFLYDWFSRYVEDRRREPRQDVLTGLATATFPDGSLPEVIDVVRVAVNLFAAGQETTVRLLGSALAAASPNGPTSRTSCAREHRPRSRTSSRRCCATRAR